ncbi:MAG TPA: hypothetical protein ENF26_05520 [Methanomicrobia archaeon]|nr:hypothetical protein [Methanomicrobia archaeon]HEX59587.1 hypothetical protein [Methanomicrobia archaeon]
MTEEAVRKFYEKAHGGGWVDCLILVNEAKVLRGWSNVHDGPVLTFTDRCEELPADVLNAIREVGLSPVTIEHRKDARVEAHCHVRFEGRELTAEELFLPNLRKWAEYFGYEVVDLPEDISPLGWGIYGDTLDDAEKARSEFSSKLGGVISSGEYTHYDSGYAFVIKTLYAKAMINVVESPPEQPPEEQPEQPPEGAREPPCDSYGDLDGDGYIRPGVDAALLNAWILGGWEFVKSKAKELGVELKIDEEEFLRRADVNADGSADMGDSLMIERYANGLEDTFPACEAAPEKPPSLMECLLPRLFGRMMFPRMEEYVLFPRLHCLLQLFSDRSK